MKILTWVVRFLFFFCFFVFAVQNTDLVVIRLLPGHDWHLPQVILLLLFFAVGAVLGASSLLGLIFRQRREISRLKQPESRQEDRAERVPDA